jgi:Carbohydrate binding domain/Secretion system C-terminal sorting domain
LGTPQYKAKKNVFLPHKIAILQFLTNKCLSMKNVITLCFCLFFAQLSAQNFTNGFNFNLPFNDSTPSVFLPFFPKKAITDAERVTVNGPNFIVAGKPYRFWGGNLAAGGAFPTKSLAPSIVGRMRKMGINLLRFHHMDNPTWSGNDNSLVNSTTTRSLNPTTLDRLDFMISEMKRQGIYANINLNVSRTFTRGDGVLGADSLPEFGKGVTIFDPQLIDLQREYARKLLTHVNPYTQKTFADDPTIAVVEMINENSLYGMWKENTLKPFAKGGGLMQRQSSLLDSLWNAFLIKKYTNQTNLQAAWTLTGGPVFTERIAGGNFENGLNANFQTEQNAGATATTTIDATTAATGSRSVKVQTTNVLGTDWHIQFKYINFSLKKDSTYIVRFSAKSSQNRVISPALMRNDAPYTWYGSNQISLTTDWQTYQFSIIPNEDIVGFGRLSFSLGTQLGTVWFDDISLGEPQPKTFLPNESLTAKNIARSDYSENAGFAKQRIADLAAFYVGLQKDFMENLRLYLKNDLGVKSAITGTNALVGIQEGLEHENMDYIDDHNYWDHPQFPNQAWSSTDWLINNRAMVKDPSGGAIVGALSGVGLANKPFTVSEYNHGFPNRFRTEMPHFMAAYGAFHGMDGVMFFTYSGENNWGNDFTDGYFDLHRDPSVLSLFPSFAYAFRNGLIAESAQPLLVNYAPNDIYKSFEKDRDGRWGKYVPYDLRLQLTRSLRAGTYQHPQGLSAQAAFPTPSSNTFQTDTRETNLNTQSGILTTQTPNFAAITGFLNDNANTTVGNLTLVNANDFGAITWLSLNQKTLAEADTSLLTISCRSQNSGAIWNANNTSTGNSGAAPTAQQPLTVSLKMTLPYDNILIHTLSTTGQSLGSRRVNATTASVFEFTLNQATDKTVWYAIEGRKKGVGTSDNAKENKLLKVFPNPTNTAISVQYSTNKAQPITLSIFDAKGAKQLEINDKDLKLSVREQRIDVSKLPNGTYFIKIGEQALPFVKL